ncbi:MAG: winged helix-turn-helix transcriptional regulator [Saprospiraceae bacterium]|nr:winged helix-turn-helix transcriptional regulator [Saprospiraceae bacterium]
MGASKKILFTPQQNRLAELAKALAHPARIAILEHLFRVNDCVCGDIVEAVPLAQSTVSQHLNELKKAGLIHGEIEGAKVCYALDPKAWADIKILLGRFLETPNCC